jgi:hypothetical protein
MEEPLVAYYRTKCLEKMEKNKQNLSGHPVPE